MAQGSKWLTRAVQGLRSFAYAGNGERPKVGVALGGGFARGIAHIGVLRVLEENEIPIDYIAGTSVGALIAATYASGTSLATMELHGSETTFRDFGRWTLSRMGMASNDRLDLFLHKFTTVSDFSELKKPLSIVATDIIAGESVYYTDGEIAPALRASCAYPGLFLPRRISRADSGGWISDRGGSLAGGPKIGRGGRDRGSSRAGLIDGRPRNTIEVISRSFSIIQSGAIQPWRAATDILIEPNVHHVLWDEFARTPELVAAGEAAARRGAAANQGCACSRTGSVCRTRAAREPPLLKRSWIRARLTISRLQRQSYQMGWTRGGDRCNAPIIASGSSSSRSERYP